MAKFNDIKGSVLDGLRRGLSQSDACKSAGCSVSQFHEWKNKYPEFADDVKKALQEFRASMVPRLENALFKRALGYEFDEVKTESFPDGGKRVTTTRKHFAPDVGALVFALCNLAPGSWRNKIENSVQGELKTTVNVSVESKDTLKEIDKLGK